MPKISIITLSHNRPQFLTTAICSVLCQTMEDWELIIIDDGSTNREVEAVLAEAQKEHRIRVFKEPENINNLAVLWNKGLDLARGEYISILDDDNKKAPQFCEKMSRYLDEHKEYDAVACLQEAIDGKNQPLPGSFRSPLPANKETILERNYIDSNEVLFRKELFDRVGYWDERLTRLEDWDMFIRIFHETSGIAILPEKLGYYRLHEERRVFQTWEQEEQNANFVRCKNRTRGQKLKVCYIQPEPQRLTWSQEQVCRGIKEVLPKISFVSVLAQSPISSYNTEFVAQSDFILVVAPFQITPEEIKKLADWRTPLVNIHMEDPQAVMANTKGAKFASWVVTNDIATIPHYQKVVDPKKVLFCPSLSISEEVLTSKENWGENFDVLVPGYAYDSRVEFIQKFLSQPLEFKLLLLGDEWDKKLGKDYPVSIMAAKNEVEMMKICRSSKIIVCLHRTNKDLGGFPVMPPKSIHRGYIEAYSGNLVMIDQTRPQHSFGENEVVLFSSPEDLKEKIHHYLAHRQEAEAMAKKAQMRATKDFTFRARLTKLLNCLHSQRYAMRIP